MSVPQSLSVTQAAGSQVEMVAVVPVAAPAPLVAHLAPVGQAGSVTETTPLTWQLKPRGQSASAVQVWAKAVFPHRPRQPKAARASRDFVSDMGYGLSSEVVESASSGRTRAKRLRVPVADSALTSSQSAAKAEAVPFFPIVERAVGRATARDTWG